MYFTDSFYSVVFDQAAGINDLKYKQQLVIIANGYANILGMAKVRVRYDKYKNHYWR